MFSSAWDERFMLLAHQIARWIKEKGRRVGAVIVGPDKEIRSTGFNGFPRGVREIPHFPFLIFALPSTTRMFERLIPRFSASRMTA